MFSNSRVATVREKYLEKNFFPGQGKVREFCGWPGKFRKDLESQGKIRVLENKWLWQAAGLEKSSVLPVLDRFLKLKTDLFLDKKLKNRSIKLYFSRFCNTQTDIVTCQNCSLFTPNNPLLFVLILHNRDRK